MKVGSMPQSLSICRVPESLSTSKMQNFSDDHTECLEPELSPIDTISSQYSVNAFEEIQG